MYNFPHTLETTDGAVTMKEPVGPQVLIVDDDPSMQRMLKTRLEREGYHVVAASDGEVGLDLIRKQVPLHRILKNPTNHLNLMSFQVDN